MAEINFTDQNFEEEVLKSETPVLLDFWAPWCVDPNTSVLTENGYTSASNIKVGMRLVSIDPETKKQVIRPVKKIKTLRDVPSKKIVLETGRSLIGDENHLVLTQGGFKLLKKLTDGDMILVDPIQKPQTYNSGKGYLYYAKLKNKQMPFIHEFLQYRLFERKRYSEIKEVVLKQLALGENNQVIAQNLKIPVGTVINWKYNTGTSAVHPPDNGQAKFNNWLGERQEGELLWERVSLIEDVEDRNVIGITVDSPQTLITNGIVSHNCAPCRIIGPVVDELAKEYEGKAKVGKLNVDQNPKTAAKYGIMSIPSLLIFKKGRVVKIMIGVQSKENLKKEINEILGN